MSEIDRARRREATAIFKLGLKASRAGIHRTLNRAPKGAGWVQCVNSPAGVMCRPEKVRESIAHFERAYQTFPDIVALNQIALGREMLGEFEAARHHFTPACAGRPLPRTSPRTLRPRSGVSHG